MQATIKLEKEINLRSLLELAYHAGGGNEAGYNAWRAAELYAAKVIHDLCGVLTDGAHFEVEESDEA